MSDLCLLAASLLVQKQMANSQLPLPSLAPPVATPRSAASDDCSTAAIPPNHAEPHPPEFSLLQSQSALSTSSTPTPTAISPTTLAQAIPTTRTLAPAAQQRVLPTRTTLTRTTQTRTTPTRTASRPSLPLPPPLPPSLDGFAPSPESVLPATPSGTPSGTPSVILPVTPPVTPPVAYSTLAAVDPSVLSTPRPMSGGQLYQQRVTALRAGRLYTRLPANSFWQSWVNATRQPTYEEWVNLLSQEAIAMSRGQGSNRLTVLLGDSLSLWYPTEQLSSDRFWLNQGISGDTTAGVLSRLSAFSQTRPDTIHVMLGINDLRRGASDAEIIHNLRQIMQTLHRQHPQAQIFVHSILPTRLASISSDRIHRINHSLSYIAKQEQVNFLELDPYFSDEYGNLRRDLTTDGLHLNPRGYAMWQWALRSRNLA